MDLLPPLRAEYSGPNGITPSASVETTGAGMERTVTLDVPDMHVAAALRDGMDLRLTVLSKADLTARFVRLIKTERAQP